MAKWEDIAFKIEDHPIDRYIKHFIEFNPGNEFSNKSRESIKNEIERQIKNSFILTSGQMKKLGGLSEEEREIRKNILSSLCARTMGRTIC